MLILRRSLCASPIAPRAGVCYTALKAPAGPFNTQRKGTLLMKNTLIFDLDGTLLNTLDDLTDAVNHALERHGFAQRESAEVASFLGHGFVWLIDRALPEGVDETAKRAVLEDFRTCYMEHCMDRTRPYDGIPALLTDLQQRGVRLAIVSNKGDAAVRELAAKYFPSVPVAVGERPDVRKKPAPDAVFAALRALDTDPADAVYAGDSEVDAETARNAALPCILVSWGFRPRAQLAGLGAAAIADSPAELLAAFERL